MLVEKDWVNVTTYNNILKRKILNYYDLTFKPISKNTYNYLKEIINQDSSIRNDDEKRELFVFLASWTNRDIEFSEYIKDKPNKDYYLKIRNSPLLRYVNDTNHLFRPTNKDFGELM